MNDPRIEALAKFLNIANPNAMHEVDSNETNEELDYSEFEAIEELSYGANLFSAEGGEYLVLTDSEADQLADEGLDEAVETLVDEMCSNLPSSMAQTLRSYFDYDYWKRDVLLSDGRGSTIASYDGDENESYVNGEMYFIYRVN